MVMEVNRDKRYLAPRPSSGLYLFLIWLALDVLLGPAEWRLITFN